MFRKNPGLQAMQSKIPGFILLPGNRHREIPFVVLIILVLLFGPADPATAADSETADAYLRQRQAMVSAQLAGRGIHDQAVLKAMSRVPRHLFVREQLRGQAYGDHPLPIGHGQTISQPYIVAFMTEVIEPQPHHRVLEIGTGSGYQAAVLAEVVARVYTVEIVPELARTAAERLKTLGYDRIETRQGDGYYGWEEAGPFDAIVVTAAAEFIPPPLITQLREGGKMIIPVGSPFYLQHLMLVEKKQGEVTTRRLMPVRFVPFRRDN